MGKFERLKGSMNGILAVGYSAGRVVEAERELEAKRGGRLNWGLKVLKKSTELRNADEVLKSSWIETCKKI